MNFKNLLLVIFCCNINFVAAQEIKARINVVRKDVLVILEAKVENEAYIFDEKLSFIFLSLKKESTSEKYEKNMQNGLFTLLPYENKIVSTIKLNIEEDQEVKTYLFIKNKNGVIAQDSLKINEISEVLKTTFLNEIEIEIKGLVVDDVKTKFGKDFYDYFFRAYNNSGTKYSFVININEKPSFGTGSVISVDIEDKKIFEMQMKPDEEFLKKAAKYALKLVDNYNKNRKTVYKIY